MRRGGGLEFVETGRHRIRGARRRGEQGHDGQQQAAAQEPTHRVILPVL
jgi:hypothetical protein